MMACQPKNKEENQARPAAQAETVKTMPENKGDYGTQVKGHYNKTDDAWISENPFYETVHFEGSDFASIKRLTDNEDEPNMGLISKQGKIVVSTKYDGIAIGFTDGFCQVALGQNWGLVNDKGEEILKPLYGDIMAEKDGIFRISKDNKYGFADKTGKILVEPKYESVDYAGSGLFFFMKEPARWGLKNFREEIIVQPEFTFTNDFVDGKVVLQKSGGEEYTVYTDGRVVKK